MLAATTGEGEDCVLVPRLFEQPVRPTAQSAQIIKTHRIFGCLNDLNLLGPFALFTRLGLLSGQTAI
jgi:hypothetical protein